MRAAPLLLLWLAACDRQAPTPSTAAPRVEARVAHARVGEGETIQLELRAMTGAGWTVTPGPVLAEGLELAPAGEEGPVRVGDLDLQIWRFEVEGPSGSYVLAPEPARATGPNGESLEIPVEPVFVDIAVTGPTGGPIADFQAVPPPDGFPWLAAGAGLAATLLVGGALAWWRGRKPPLVPPPPPVPPDVAALRAWEAARLAGLDDHPLAVELSRILRVYLEAVTDIHATARTTREILRDLDGQTRMGPALTIRAAHVLDATDRLKFAREGGGARFFDELEQDFHAVVEALRPRPALPEEPGDV